MSSEKDNLKISKAKMEIQNAVFMPKTKRNFTKLLDDISLNYVFKQSPHLNIYYESNLYFISCIDEG